MPFISRIPACFPPISWILVLVCVSPVICASVWRSDGTRTNEVVRLEKGPRFHIPSSIREALRGKLGQDEFVEEPENIPQNLDSDSEFEAADLSSEWETVLDPRFYIITELGSQDASNSQGIRRRRHANPNPSPSLSIVNPLDVLRQRLLFEIARRRQKQSHSQIIANNEILKNIGRK